MKGIKMGIQVKKSSVQAFYYWCGVTLAASPFIFLANLIVTRLP